MQTSCHRPPRPAWNRQACPPQPNEAHDINFHRFLAAALGACPSNGRNCDGSEMSRMRDGGSSRLSIMSLRDPTTKQAEHFRPTPRGGVLFGPPLRRGSSEYHLRQVGHRRRFLMGAKNHPGAPGSQLGDYSDRLLASLRARPQWSSQFIGFSG